jgi:hypothetical protein
LLFIPFSRVLHWTFINWATSCRPGEHEFTFSVWLRSILPIDHPEVIRNAQVARDLNLNGNGAMPISLEPSQFCAAVGACCRHKATRLSTLFLMRIPAPPRAQSASVWLAHRRTPTKARNLIAWIDRLTAAAVVNKDWNTEAEKDFVLRILRPNKISHLLTIRDRNHTQE